MAQTICKPMQKLSKIFLDIAKSISSSGVQFIITLFTTPIMTRLYDPSAYATFSIINTTATIVIGIGLLSLPNAHLIEKQASARKELMSTILKLLCVLCLLSAMVSVGLVIAEASQIDIGISGIVLVLFPILVLTYGVRSIMVNIAIAHANFSSTALGQILEPACSRGGSIILGTAFGGHPAFILFSVAVGHIVTIITIFKMVLKNTLNKWRSLIRPSIKPRIILKRYADFVLYNTASQQAQPLALLGIQISIEAFYSSHIAGQYILALSILTLPVTLIALTTAPVVYRHFIEIERTDSSKLALHLTVAMASYLLLGVCLLAPIYLFGEQIFTFAFGSVWAEAGAIASTLSLAYVSTFAIIGLQSVFTVIGRLKMQFLLESASSIVALFASIWCFKTVDLNTAMHYLSIIWFSRNIMLLCAGVAATFCYTKSAKRIK